GQIELKDFAAAREHLDNVSALMASAPADKVEAERNWRRTSIDLLWGKWYLRQGNYKEAVPRLRAALRSTDRLKGQIEGAEELTVDAIVLLAEAYGQHDHRLLAAETYERAFAEDRSNAELGQAAAEAWSTAGNSAKAQTLAREILTQSQPPAATLLLMA